MKDLKTALQDLAKAKGFNTDGLSEKELFQIVTGIQQPSDEMISGEFASWYVPGGAAVEQEKSDTESTDETPNPDTELTDKNPNPDTELTDKNPNPDADTTPAKDVDSSDEPTDTTDETENQSNSTVDVEGDEN